ncbi:MAG TPA: ribbon-helix-helix protein, CopG family [Solirubrobacteraceae bacterium]|nr:ribbon-helix-helix protein, CopG family [Solirubrobacteraceae bacterium]
MAKVRTTLTVDEDVLRAVKLRAAHTGKGDSEVIEEALRRDLGLDVLDEIWSSIDALPEGEAMDLAREAQRAARR